MPGAYFSGTCYASQGAALDAYYGESPLALSGNGTALRFEKQAGMWQVIGYHVEANGSLTYQSTTAAPVQTFPDCDPSESFFDGVTIGWGIATAMVLAAAVARMRQGAR